MIFYARIPDYSSSLTEVLLDIYREYFQQI